MLDPFKVNYYVGETDLTMGADRAQRSFAPANWQRLEQLGRKYDPEGVFFDYLGSAWSSADPGPQETGGCESLAQEPWHLREQADCRGSRQPCQTIRSWRQ